MKQLTTEEFLARIREGVKHEGSVRAAARKFEVSHGYLTDVLNGRRQAGQQLQSVFGVKRTVETTITYTTTEETDV